MALAVELPGRTDYIISSLDDGPRTYGPVRMAGRFGMASVDADGNLLRAYLLDGTELSCGDRALKLATPRTVRKVVKADGSTIELNEPLPAGISPVRAYLLSGETGFEIEAVEGRSLTVRNYPFVGGEEIVIPNAVWFSAKRMSNQ